MMRFLVGVVIGVAVVLLALFCYVRFGFVDPRADAEVGALEQKIAMPALDAAVDRRAPDVKNPIQPTGENLMAGMKVYQAACAECHGDIVHPHVDFGSAFYPRVPQFVEDAPDMPENQNFYIIQHGVRLTGMPSWKSALKEQEIWQVTTFLSHMDKLPPQITAAWKAEAGGSESGDSSPAAESNAETKDKKARDMSAH
jgi:mono/diheme cytochrome c family protein